MLLTAMTLAAGVANLLSSGPGQAADAQLIDATSFRCITSMTPVRQFYVNNLRGDLAATLAAANSPTGAVYPPGSVIQLIPGEAMVKREKGFSPATHDWEFNRFGGNCFACHITARPQWDLVCESDHGCAPIPVTRAMIGALQRTDPRCNAPAPAPEDVEALRQLPQLLTDPDATRSTRQ